VWVYGTHQPGVRGFAIAVSLVVHGVVFWSYGDQFWRTDWSAESSPLPTIVARLSLPAPADNPTPSTEQFQVSTPQVALPKPRPVAPVIPAPMPEPAVVKPKPVAEVSKPVEPEQPPEPEEKSDVIAPTEQTPTPPQTSSPSAVAVAEPASPTTDQSAAEDEEAALRHYLAALRAAIAAHKSYPAMARRRGIEGNVKVSFTLLADGNVRDIRVTGGPRPLRNAARQAINRAVQLPPPPAGVVSPMPVQYAMNFSLR
jgi:periplasmic protein TonB